MNPSVADNQAGATRLVDEFFIGWLPMPGGYRRFLRWSLVPVFTLVVILAGLLPSQQQSPGNGVWDTDRVVTLEGLAIADPYAVLYIPADRPDKSPRTVLLVEAGKFGAVERLRPVASQVVRVTGTLLHRDDRWMLELVPGESAIEIISTARPIALPSETGRTIVKLRGEIIDPKCYLGAMKPGGGKTHKACAVLCLSGGIPPMFVTRDAEQHETYYLLLSPDGRAIRDPILPFVGDPVELAGTSSQRGDLRLLRLDVASIRRL